MGDLPPILEALACEASCVPPAAWMAVGMVFGAILCYLFKR